MKKTKLKSELTNKLISEGLVHENDVIRHSYTNNRINDWETRGTQVKDNNISPTIDTRCDCLGVVVREGGLFDNENGTHQAGSVYNENGLSPSLDTMQGGYRQPMIEEKKSNLRIRKLTPCECYKLMGFSEEDYKKASQVNSDSQLYKQAGNSIVVNVLMAIFGEMLDTKDEREEGENDIMPKLMGGVGEMKSNSGTQYYQQDRIYSADSIALCQSAHESFNPYYEIDDDTTTD